MKKSRSNDELAAENEAAAATATEETAEAIAAGPTGRPLYRIDFEAEHTQYLNVKGEELTSVTTALKVIDKPALIFWAWKEGKAGRNLNRTKQKAADIGTIAHAMVECHLLGMELDRSNLAPDQVDRAETAFIKFLDWWQSMGFQVVHCELKMIDEHWQVGGTADIIAFDREGKLWLIDLKTSKGIYDEMKFQTAAYADMYERNYFATISNVAICRIGKEDDPEDFEAYVMPDAERKAALAVYSDLLPFYRSVSAFRQKYSK